MVVTCLLEPYVVDGNTSYEMLNDILNDARSSRTGRVWVDCLILPVVILHLFIKAVRESDWDRHLYYLQRMLPYFFAAGHWNYARYIQWHVLEITALG